MANYYIATRANHTDMASATGQRVGRLNQKMAATLRKAAMGLGIKQNTRDGGRLEFYSVDQSGFDMLSDPKNKMFAVLKGATNVRPLAYLDSDKLGTTINEVNARYSRRMDRATFAKYERDLEQATGSLLTKMEDDVRAEKPKSQNPGFKVGDMITHSDWRTTYPAVITKITAAGYQYQIYIPYINTYRCKDVKDWVKGALDSGLKKVEGWGDDWDGNVKIPFAANKSWFKLVAKKYNRRWSTMGTYTKPGQTDVNFSASWHTD